jgi:hypothetical protein
MKVGLCALLLLTGLVAMLALLNFAGFQDAVRLAALFPFLVMVGAVPLLAFMLACLWGISRGHRVAAILVLFVPVFLSLPLVTEVIAIGSMTLMDDSHEADAWFLWFIILFRLFMLAVLVAAWPLAFGAANPFPRVLSLFNECRKACSEKCFGKWRARQRHRRARLHAEEARALFEAVAVLRQREGIPIESVIASYDDIERRYGQDEAPAVCDWVERAREEKNAILRAQGRTAAAYS